MSKIATCGCGALRVEVKAEPIAVVVCHCIECQRRSGSPFGVGAYYKREQASVSGSYAVYVRNGDSGHKFTTNFCPACGSTVFWETAFKPDEIGVAVGAFADPNFPNPVRSVWERSRHAWVKWNLKIPRYLMGRSGGPIEE